MKTALTLLLFAVFSAMRLNAQVSCFEWYLINQNNKIGLRNKCDDCKIAVVSFNYNNGKHEEKEFKVAGHSSVVVDKYGTKEIKIIDAKNCK